MKTQRSFVIRLIFPTLIVRRKWRHLASRHVSRVQAEARQFEKEPRVEEWGLRNQNSE